MAAAAAPPTLSSLSATQTEARQTAQAYLNSRLANEDSKAKGSDGRFFTIPNIDISRSFSTSLSERMVVASQIHTACTTSGFFTITGHGIPEPTRQSILSQAERFFKMLPRESKEKLHIKHSPYFRGWEPAESTYVNPADWEGQSVPETKEGFNWGYEDGLDVGAKDGQYVELDGKKALKANAWPSEEDLPGFYEGVKEYYSQILELARHLFRLFALSLDLEETYFDAMTTHPGGIARLLYYPPSKNPEQRDKKTEEIGLGAHSDYECFTILLSSTTPGLEILSPSNTWIPAPYVSGSFTINVADFLMRWTNDRYRSTVHRVVNRTGEERYSVPFFFSVNYDQMVEVLPSCVDAGKGEVAKYGPVRAGEYILERLKATTKEE